jgi:hypothetical protein
VVGRSNHILLSFTKPVPLGLFTIIISPRSCTCNFMCAAYLYTIYLFSYSTLESEILHRMSPLLLRIPAYSYLLLDFVAHSITSLYSPCGAVTLLHPVSNPKSFPNCVESAVFHSSLFPLYLRVYESRETVL